VEIIDYTGPYEVFGAEGYEVFTVAESKSPITTAGGMKVIPRYTFADAPPADLVLIPGGGVKVVKSDKPTLEWIKQESAKAEHVMSVCNGAFTLANTGLLNGLTVTTTAHNINPLRLEHPELRVVRDQRVVDNGKFITTGGLSAGIDGALHYVSLMEGNSEAQEVARFLEYDWQPNGQYFPATYAIYALPERQASRKLAALGDWGAFVSTGGDRDHWSSVRRFSSKLGSAELIEAAGKAYDAAGNWSAVTIGKSSGTWRFVDLDGQAWVTTLSVETEGSQRNQYLFKVELSRAT
jgi:putative intracellular protease/amidase